MYLKNKQYHHSVLLIKIVRQEIRKSVQYSGSPSSEKKSLTLLLLYVDLTYVHESGGFLHYWGAPTPTVPIMPISHNPVFSNSKISLFREFSVLLKAY